MNVNVSWAKFGTRSGLVLSCLSALWTCGPAAAPAAAGSNDVVEGMVKVDGSSTVQPILAAAAEMFREKQPKVQVTVGISGTGGGFKKFLDDSPSLRTDISNASRPISASELKKAGELKVDFIELPIALDGLAVVVHPSNTFAANLTVAELKKVWSPDSTVKNWKDVRAGFPDLSLKLYGPGPDSGTFDYFTEVIVGKAKSSRSDYMASENDNTLVQGVSGDKGALGYFGLSYLETNKSKLKAVAIDPGDGKAVLPSVESTRNGTYHPLGRPLFIYVNAESLKRTEVRAFVEFIVENAGKIAEHPRVGYVGLPNEVYDLAKKRLKDGKTGSAMAKAPAGPTNLLEVFKSN